MLLFCFLNLNDTVRGKGKQRDEFGLTRGITIQSLSQWIDFDLCQFKLINRLKEIDKMNHADVHLNRGNMLWIDLFLVLRKTTSNWHGVNTARHKLLYGPCFQTQHFQLELKSEVWENVGFHDINSSLDKTCAVCRICEMEIVFFRNTINQTSQNT